MPKFTTPDRCTYRDISGRRCRLPRKPTHQAFCSHHARFSPEGILEDPQALLAEILGPSPDFANARALNKTVGKLLESFLAGRLPARHAAIAGYLCQLLIQTLPQIERQERPPEPERIEYQYVSNTPRPDYSQHFRSTPSAPNEGRSDQGEARNHPEGISS